jgi:hypothetical protein
LTDDVEKWAGAYVSCYIEFADSRGAEVLARWYLGTHGWIPECVLEMYSLDPDDADPEDAAYVREAQEDGYCLVYHQWPAGAEDADEDDAGSWCPPGEGERRLAEIAGDYVNAEGQVLVLGTDRHFGWGRGAKRDSGTWHVNGDELTLAYFPSMGCEKAILDTWRVLPDALVGERATLLRERTAE